MRQSEVANIEADNLQKTQEMLVEFSQAQQILKDKIRQLQNMLVAYLLTFFYLYIYLFIP